jgi:hypothetical protein
MHSLFIFMMGLFSIGSVTEKLQITFHEVFPNANRVIWTESKGTHAVYFYTDDIRSMMFFDSEGEFVESTRYYSGEHLPLSIRWKLMNRFPGMHVTGVTESTSFGGVRYSINMENTIQLITVLTDEGGKFVVTEKLKRQA